ncbi:MAG: hypothetical protein KAR42_15540 [candidate division Zixibacteria bacterium]|nr:hypothetical protein [candidate division Zixibacteria bacterium]
MGNSLQEHIKRQRALGLDAAYRRERRDDNKNYRQRMQFRANRALVADRGINAIPRLFTAANSKLTKMEIVR